MDGKDLSLIILLKHDYSQNHYSFQLPIFGVPSYVPWFSEGGMDARANFTCHKDRVQLGAADGV